VTVVGRNFDFRLRLSRHRDESEIVTVVERNCDFRLRLSRHRDEISGCLARVEPSGGPETNFAMYGTSFLAMRGIYSSSILPGAMSGSSCSGSSALKFSKRAVRVRLGA